MKTTLTLALSFALAACALAAPEVSDSNPPKSKNTELNFNLKPRPIQYTRGNIYGNTIWGATGLIAVPTAFVADPRSLTLGATFSEDLSSGFVNFGLFENLEAGVALFDRPGNNDHAILNAKLYVPLTFTERFQLAVGAIDFADQDGQSFYAVASSRITVPDVAAEAQAIGLNLHFGIGTGYFDGHIFGGAEFFFADGFDIIAEWDANDFNAGLRYRFRPEFSGEIGFYSTNPYIKLGYNVQF